MNTLNRKISSNNPVSILVHGANDLAYEISKTLVEQGGNVILVDEYNSKSKKYITKLKELGKVDFVDFKGLDDLIKKLPRIDYLFYFLQDYLIQNDNFSSSEFLNETSYLNTTVKAAKTYNSKLSLITSIKLNQDLAAHILNKKLSAPSPYSNIELQKYCETLTAEARDKTKINTRIIRVGTILGSENQFVEDPTVKRLLQEAISKPEVTIYGEGLDIHYVLHISDASYGVLKLTFSEKTEGEVISLTNNHDYTTLSLAYKLLELNPDLQQIKFAPTKEDSTVIFDQYIPSPNATNYGWVQKNTLEQTLGQAIRVLDESKGAKILERPSETLKPEVIEHKSESLEVTPTLIGKFVNFVSSPFKLLSRKTKDLFNREKEDFTPVKAVKMSFTLVTLLLVLYFIFIPIIGIGISFSLLYSNLKTAQNGLLGLDFDKSSIYLEKSQKNVTKAEEHLERSKWMFSLIGQQKLFDNTAQILSATDYGLNGGATLSKALKPLAQYAKDFKPAIDLNGSTPSSTREYRLYLKELETNLKGIDNATYSIDIASQMFSSLDATAFPLIIQSYIIQLKQTNDSIISNLLPVKDILPYLPDILGVDERQRYLILFQNPGELRSTGGWLSSYAIVSIEGGQIRELKVDDIYNAEGQLKVAGKSFDAPKDMQKALGLTKWSMSLSNWSPQFEDSANSAMYFLNQLDPGTDFDAVIAIDTSALKKFLDKWGGVNVPGESVLITSQNIDEKIFQLHKDFEPGDSVKSTFLANLANESLRKLFSLDFNGLKDVSDAIFSSLNEKNILVFFNNTEVNKYFEKNGWNGNIKEENLWTPVSIEWNWGANKANLYLDKNYSTSLNIQSDSKIEYEYTMFVKNKSISNIYPQGDYVNYQRIVLPKKASVKSVKGFDGDKYSTNIQNGHLVISGWFTTPIKNTKSLQVKYVLERSLDEDNFPITRSESEKVLDFEVFKQPGTFNDIYDISITFPETWATKQHDGLNQSLNVLTARFTTQQDKEYDVVWEEKN